MSRIIFDYSKLKGRITEKLGTQKVFADMMGISESALSTKLNCDTYFSQKQILKAAGILGIEEAEIGVYFFTQAVQETEQE